MQKDTMHDILIIFYFLKRFCFNVSAMNNVYEHSDILASLFMIYINLRTLLTTLQPHFLLLDSKNK